jgi:hypothetical protein
MLSRFLKRATGLDGTFVIRTEGVPVTDRRIIRIGYPESSGVR